MLQEAVDAVHTVLGCLEDYQNSLVSVFVVFGDRTKGNAPRDFCVMMRDYYCTDSTSHGVEKVCKDLTPAITSNLLPYGS